HLGVGQRVDEALHRRLVGGRVDRLDQTPALVALLERDLPVRKDEVDAGDGVLVDAEELRLLALLTRLRHLVDPQVGTEPGHEDEGDEGPAPAHSDLRRRQSRMPRASRSWGLTSTERET